VIPTHSFNSLLAVFSPLCLEDVAANAIANVPVEQNQLRIDSLGKAIANNINQLRANSRLGPLNLLDLRTNNALHFLQRHLCRIERWIIE